MKIKKPINTVIGDNIKREREKAGYTQERFSELVGIGPKSLSAIERGTVGISLDLLLRIRSQLSVSADDLLLPCVEKNNTRDLAERLERLNPEEYEITCDVVYKLLEAFSLNHE